MVPMLQLPRTHFGFGAIHSLLEELAALGVERPLFVTDSGLVACGVFRAAGARFAGRNFDGIPENPTVDAVERILSIYRGALTDCFGHPDNITAAVAPLIAIPTTAGTGSEASRGAGIHPTALDCPLRHSAGRCQFAVRGGRG